MSTELSNNTFDPKNVVAIETPVVTPENILHPFSNMSEMREAVNAVDRQKHLEQGQLHGELEHPDTLETTTTTITKKPKRKKKLTQKQRAAKFKKSQKNPFQLNLNSREFKQNKRMIQNTEQQIVEHLDKCEKLNSIIVTLLDTIGIDETVEASVLKYIQDNLTDSSITELVASETYTNFTTLEQLYFLLIANKGGIITSIKIYQELGKTKTLLKTNYMEAFQRIMEVLPELLPVQQDIAYPVIKELYKILLNNKDLFYDKLTAIRPNTYELFVKILHVPDEELMEQPQEENLDIPFSEE